MILARFRSTPEARPTPTELAKQHKRVRLTPHVITRLPNKDYKPRRCDGHTCLHEHAGVSRLPQVRIGRRWLA